jgi:hypothetical protein
MYKNEYKAYVSCIVSNTNVYKPFEEYYITSVIKYGKLGSVDYLGRWNYDDKIDYSIYLPKSRKKYADGGDVKSKNNKIEWVKNVGEQGWSAKMESKNAYENSGGYVSTSGNWKIYRSGRWYYDKYIGGDNFKRDGDWGVYRNDELYGEFDSLKEAKQYVENWVRINPKDYADGGDVPHEDKMFQLPLEMVIYVPSTQDVDKVISVDKMDKRVDEVKEYLASKFGGYTSSDKLGGYVDSKGNLVNEDVVQITSFSTKEAFEENKKELVEQIAKWAKDWGQEAIGFEFEGDLMYVPQKLKEGGELKNDKKMEIIKQNNRMIAEFMGAKYDKDTSFPIHPNDLWLPMHGVCNFTSTNGNCLRYHSSWDWLMPVVEKIESLSKENETYSFSITKFSVRVLYRGSRVVDLPIDNTKFESTYQAVIQFIELYNKQNM